MEMQGKLALVTGATDGLGRAVALRLGAAGARVLVHGRDAGRGAEVVRGIVEAGGDAGFVQADLATAAGTRALAEAVLAAHDRLDLLINNAGIGTGPQGAERQTSPDGNELRFQVNYLAPVLLTRMLLPALKKAAPSRIVMVASAGQQPIDFDDVMLTRDYSGQRAYRQSKLAMVMAAMDFAEELQGTGVTVTALHPATYMDTTMVRESGVAPANPVETGVQAVMHLAADGRTEGVTGEYFDGTMRARARPQAYDPEARERLREMTEAWLSVPA